jgi:hypothetical protein
VKHFSKLLIFARLTAFSLVYRFATWSSNAVPLAFVVSETLD